MKVIAYLDGGPHQGLFTNLPAYEDIPVDLRVARLAEDDRSDEVEVQVYRLLDVQPVGPSGLFTGAHYLHQGTMMSAWSLVDVLV